MKILNLHGFMGEADNKNYKALCDIIPAENIISPQLHYKEKSPKEILDMLSAFVNSENFIFVGQSLGGWFADKLSRKFSCSCILTNPCYYPHELDLITESGISEEFVKKYQGMSVNDKNEFAYTLCSDRDTVLPDNYMNCAKLSKSVTKVHGSHSTIENIGEHLRSLLKKTEERYNVEILSTRIGISD